MWLRRKLKKLKTDAPYLKPPNVQPPICPVHGLVESNQGQPWFVSHILGAKTIFLHEKSGWLQDKLLIRPEGISSTEIDIVIQQHRALPVLCQAMFHFKGINIWREKNEEHSQSLSSHEEPALALHGHPVLSEKCIFSTSYSGTANTFSPVTVVSCQCELNLKILNFIHNFMWTKQNAPYAMASSQRLPSLYPSRSTAWDPSKRSLQARTSVIGEILHFQVRDWRVWMCALCLMRQYIRCFPIFGPFWGCGGVTSWMRVLASRGSM